MLIKVLLYESQKYLPLMIHTYKHQMSNGQKNSLNSTIDQSYIVKEDKSS